MSTERISSRHSERRFEVGADAELRVNNVRGNVRVTGSTGTTVSMRLELDPEHRLSDEDLERAPIEIEHEGDRVSIKVLSDQAIRGWFERRSGPPSVHCTLEVPERTRATISCVSADVSLAGLHGKQVVNTVSGKVVATGIRGDVQVNTVSGSALITEANGALRWNTVSGDLILRDSQTSALHANSISGGAEVALAAGVPEGVQVQTVSGDLRLTVPANFACEASLSSMSGNARTTLPAQIVEARRGRWRAVINGGGPPVRMSSMSGSLYLSSGNGAATAQVPASPTSSAAGSKEPSDERLRILRQVERNEISIEEGLARLDALRQQSTPSGEVL